MKTQFLLAGLIGLIAAAAPTAVHAQRELQRKECVTRIETCEAILREFQADPATAIPAQILARARAIVITNQFKAGFILGIKDGYGVLMAKKTDGQWSLPVLIRAGEASLGLQVGGRAIETVYIFNDDQTPRRLFSQRLNVGVDASAIAGPKGAEAGFLSSDDKANRLFYETTYTMPEILDSDWITPPSEVQPLMAYVRSIAP